MAKKKTSDEIPPKPEFDYGSFPHLTRDGFRTSGNFKIRTRSLFREECPEGEEAEVMWTLSDQEYYCPVQKRWIPSACLVYIHADDEYDALRKIVGSSKQWDTLKETKWFPAYLEMWQAEQAHLQKSAIRAQLLDGVLSGGPGYVSAARTLLDMIDGKQAVGRPKRKKNESEKKEDRSDDDYKRVVGIHE